MGGGAPRPRRRSDCELLLSMTMAGLDSHCFRVYANALDVIPYTPAKNAGLSPSRS